MLGGDRRLIELAYSLQFTMPGTPVLRYGEEIGMGDNLSLRERNSIRTPMQWSDAHCAGFSDAPPDALVRPLVQDRQYGPARVNVASQRQDDASLLVWMERLLRTLRECPEIGQNSCDVVDSGHPAVLAHRFAGPTGEMLFLHNLGSDAVTLELEGQLAESPQATEVFADRDYGDVDPKLRGLRVEGLGYRWLRLRFSP
jgi:maltose alpha-D-glucosyltransferase/alpha-amylase